jgi:predicted secreted protein
MAFQSGHVGKMKLGATGGTDTVLGVTSWSADISGEALETTSKLDSPSRNRTYIPGLVGGEFSADLIFDRADTNGQVALFNALINGTTPTVNLYVESGSYFSGAVVVTGYSPSSPVDDKEMLTVNGTFTGPVTFTNP